MNLRKGNGRAAAPPAAIRFNGAAGMNLRKAQIHRFEPVRRRRFNGAAGMNLRKVPIQIRSEFLPAGLQWGRRNEPAEGGELCTNQCRAVCASMGPQE